jgi:hypothetical protein
MRYRITDPFWAFLGRTLLKPIVAGVLAVAALFEGYFLMQPTGASIEMMRRRAAERTCKEVAADLPKRAGVPSLAVLNLAGDPSGVVTQMLREEVAAGAEYRVLEEPFFRKLLRELGKDNVPVSRLSDAVALARGIGVDLVLFGEVSPAPEGIPQLKLEMRMAERQSGQAVFVRSYGNPPAGKSSWRSRLEYSSKGRRIFIWVVFTLLLPIATIPLLRRVVALDSNLLNLALLLTYTALDVVAAHLLTGAAGITVWSSIILLAALVAGLCYNYGIASLIDDLQR